MTQQLRTSDGFRVPNSVVQSLTTSWGEIYGNGTGLNRLTAFQTVTLLGLMSLVNTRHPEREVRTTPAQLLRIIEVSKAVAHAVDREWTTAEGEQRHARYPSTRWSPKLVAKIHDALRTLFDKTVVLRHYSKTGADRRADRIVHVLDSFGYVYEQNGRTLDLHDLPVGLGKVNVGSSDRPIWRVCSSTDQGSRFQKARAVVFRLNAELARELRNERNTIGFTYFARRVFGLFRNYIRSPAMIRLIILILRQTGDRFSRGRASLVEDLGFDVSHAARAADSLEARLEELKAQNIIQSFHISPEGMVTMEINRQWHQGDGTMAAGP